VVISQKLVPTADRKGRLAVHDILVNTPAISNLIREGKTFQIPSSMQTGRREGMQLMDTALLEAARAGTVTGIDAWEAANDKSGFQQWAPKESLGNTTMTGHTSAGAAPATSTGIKKAG
jgi:twitching motility protein PilT